jgi:hypothetical protein
MGYPSNKYEIERMVRDMMESDKAPTTRRNRTPVMISRELHVMIALVAKHRNHSITQEVAEGMKVWCAYQVRKKLYGDLPLQPPIRLTSETYANRQQQKPSEEDSDVGSLPDFSDVKLE